MDMISMFLFFNKILNVLLPPDGLKLLFPFPNFLIEFMMRLFWGIDGSLVAIDFSLEEIFFVISIHVVFDSFFHFESMIDSLERVCLILMTSVLRLV